MRGMLKRSVGILLVIAFASAGRAEKPDHLVPAAAPGLSVDAYSQELDRAFDLSGTPAWGGVVMLPSFRGESVVWLRSTPTGPEVETRTADAYIWSARVLLRRGAVKQEVIVRSQRAPLSLATFRALQDAWEAMLQRVREPDSEHRGCDGTSYWFFVASDHPDKRLAGSTWSPGRDGLPGCLAWLARDLATLATASPEARPALWRRATRSRCNRQELARTITAARPRTHSARAQRAEWAPRWRRFRSLPP